MTYDEFLKLERKTYKQPTPEQVGFGRMIWDAQQIKINNAIEIINETVGLQANTTGLINDFQNKLNFTEIVMDGRQYQNQNKEEK